MHKEVLTQKQTELLPGLAEFSADFGLVGGTAIALLLGHRQSIDFDLASTQEAIDSRILRKKISKFGTIEAVIVDTAEEYTLALSGVKFTFFNYPFPVKFSQDLDGLIRLPDLNTLAAMKAYALGRRAKWKDYVDLFFVIKNLGSLDPVISQSKKIFGAEFNEKNFRAALAYFEDIDFSEQVVFLPGFAVEDEEIKAKLREYSLM